MESIGGASTESEDEGETGEEEPMECPSPLTRVSPPEPSPPLDDGSSKTVNGNSKEQLNIGGSISIVSRLAPPITGRRPSVPLGSTTTVSSAATSAQTSKTTTTAAAAATPQKIYYSLPKFQTSSNELIIIGDSRIESV